MTNDELATAIEQALEEGRSTSELVDLARKRGVAGSVPVFDIPRILRRFPVGQDGTTDKQWLGKYQWPQI